MPKGVASGLPVKGQGTEKLKAAQIDQIFNPA